MALETNNKWRVCSRGILIRIQREFSSTLKVGIGWMLVNARFFAGFYPEYSLSRNHVISNEFVPRIRFKNRNVINRKVLQIRDVTRMF